MSQTKPTPSGKPAADDNRLGSTLGTLFFLGLMAFAIWHQHKSPLNLRPGPTPAGMSVQTWPVPATPSVPLYEGLSDDEKRAAQRTERPLGEDADRFDRKVHGLTPLP